MNNIKLIAFLYIILNPVFNYSQNIYVDQSLLQNVDLFQLNEPLNLWLNFLKTQDDKIGSKFWNNKEIEQFSDSTYFQMSELDYFELGNKIKTLNYGTTVLSITKSDSLFKITSKFEYRISDSTSVTPFIFHVYATKEKSSDSLKLYNPFPINKMLHFQELTFKNITYVYPKSHKFNKSLAKKQYRILNNIEKDFDLSLENSSFIFTSDRTSYFQMRGYDFHFQNNGIEYPSGNADVLNNTVYSYGSDEYYPHELIHLLINPKWPNAHGWFLEGFATYFGGSRGKTLDWHLEKLNTYLLKNPELDLNNLLELKNMDDFTDFRYVIGGLFIKIAYEKGGTEMVTQLMTSENSDIGFYKTIESTLGIKKQSINQYIRDYLKK